MLDMDSKRELFRHLVAALAFRARVAIEGVPADFGEFRLDATIRTPGEILAHLGDLLQGSLFLMKGEFVHLNSAPLPWAEEVARFFSAVAEFDNYLASDAPLATRRRSGAIRCRSARLPWRSPV